MRSLMTDTIEILEVTPTLSPMNETIYNFADAEVVASGLGSFQTFFSAEYDVDRDTFSLMGRIITDDPALDPTGKSWVRVNGGEVMEVDGKPQIWSLRGQHHIEFNVKRVEG